MEKIENMEQKLVIDNEGRSNVGKMGIKIEKEKRKGNDMKGKERLRVIKNGWMEKKDIKKKRVEEERVLCKGRMKIDVDEEKIVEVSKVEEIEVDESRIRKDNRMFMECLKLSREKDDIIKNEDESKRIKKVEKIEGEL